MCIGQLFTAIPALQGHFPKVGNCSPCCHVVFPCSEFFRASAGKEQVMTESTNGSVWIKRAAFGVLALGMLGITACGSSHGGGYYRDGYYYGEGRHYRDSDHRHYHRHDRDHDGYRDRGYYDRNGYWHRY
jgi:hypothetical protein